MRRRVAIFPEAERELAGAFEWYEVRRRGLGFEFLRTFDATLERIARLPHGHERLERRTRKALMRRFPFLILYSIEDERVLVTAVFHARRDPGLWSDRVREGVVAAAEMSVVEVS